MKEYPVTASGRSRAEFVMAADTLAAMGLACLMNDAGKRVTCLPAGESFHLLPVLRTQDDWQLTVVMPADPLEFLRFTDRIVMLIKCSSVPPHIIILSHAPAGWLLETLSAQGCAQTMLCNVTVLPSRINCRQLFMMISGTVKPSLFRLRADYTGSVLPVLTPREYTAVYSWLAGYSSHAFAEKAHRSVKTFYGQRYSGLCKLASVFPFLKPRRRIHPRLKEQKRSVQE
ncbi:hypothetical protein [Pantoea ananatis]|uniref:hypothetical protein n=1 Tax=Pantoea ananas TaxID=553 RepID=UPI001575C312|nr:hypothetical protein [Pantoea ananatis]NQE78194.1 hypothetical protein [Pantoea ananatis]NQE83658.1 hypothetical protein [Pantoea ananatis]